MIGKGEAMVSMRCICKDALQRGFANLPAWHDRLRRDPIITAALSE
jgi:hypothetical protein